MKISKKLKLIIDLLCIDFNVKLKYDKYNKIYNLSFTRKCKKNEISNYFPYTY